MASAVQTLRLCLRACRTAPVARRFPPRTLVAARPISTTPIRWRASNTDDNDLEDDDTGEEDDEKMYELESKITQQETKEAEEALMNSEKLVAEMEEMIRETERLPKKARDTFWGEEEDDTDLIAEGTDDDDFSEDDIMSMAHGKLEEHREYREYARIAAWQMPLLSKLARPFVPPTAEECLRFRYTSYMGEDHPAQNKVVVEFSPRDVGLNEAQQLKLRKLLGPRWNPETDVAKMSCEQFGHQAQNKRYLGDVIETLIAQARDPTDMFEDVPLDTRHHKFKVKPRFPKEWRLTEERRLAIEDARQKSLLLDQEKVEAGALVDGKEKVERFFAQPVPAMKIPELVAARLPNRQPRQIPRTRQMP
ncbi:mitochondrial ribosomal subunit protein-domain-containing protein [Pseudomassariella vexata]|uniref:Mitochondrial ribosomal subunit protein-domain-containing protein n=1 Tax=Pseudomassariella vexata TaxID=1141098 RepID=A0A1Y2E080_9PEZI|nr:mitochondrial ribosomal subunit protein-domain-containing protein [Pseudomassariella vexata]ORY64941.1 mitochondrial ribosomal subunit protein-domain-containing protein [Pseudomassariella vexata]